MRQGSTWLWKDVKELRNLRICYRHTFICFLFFLPIRLTGSFKVTTPQENVVGVHGQPAILECTYSPVSGTVLNDLIINWQISNSKVVHSFYNGEDQFDVQDPAYRNRTHLYLGELLNGNVTLKLDGVRLRDEGQYDCHVSSKQGVSKAHVNLKFAAFFTEPLLTVQVNPKNVTFSYESRGYPKPEVLWTDLKGRTLSHSSSVEPSKVDKDLLCLHTYLVVDRRQQVNYTITMKNRPLQQIIERTVVFRNGANEYHKDSMLQRWIHISLVLNTAVLLLNGFPGL